MVCKLLLHPALCLCAELPAPEMYKWKQSLSVRWQKDFQELEKLPGGYTGMGRRRKCPRQFWILTSHPLSIPLPGAFRRRLLESLGSRPRVSCWTLSTESYRSEENRSLWEGERRQSGEQGQRTANSGLWAECRGEETKGALQEGSAGSSAPRGLLFCLFSAFKNVTVV